MEQERTTTADAEVPGGPPKEILEETAAAFALLASPVRLRILWTLSRGESDVARIADRVGGALSTVSQHLSALGRSGLVGSRRDGRRHVYFVDDPGVIAVVRDMTDLLATRTATRPPPAPPTGPRHRDPGPP
ncbi:ArsR/SmtB family transcription factor [Streptomyces sp. NPDC057242]|uniref:ArsR/SmtB family transcription factor n=1 Tax=unclassified Streptomyces TaxID=2593676 RepID=UPI003624C903